MRAPRRGDLLTGAAAVAVLATAAGLFLSRSVNDATLRPPPPSDPASSSVRPSAAATAGAPSRASVQAGTIGAATTVRPAAVRVRPAPDAPVASRLRPGILLPVVSADPSFVRVLTPCEVPGFLARGDVRLHPKATGEPRVAEQATVLLDPGHGGSLDGAVGTNGTPEKEPNLEIAKAVRERLRAGRVFLTRDGDYTAGLEFRATLANTLRAHAFVSIHNNAEPDGPFPRPGTETYYQRSSAASKRLAGLTYEELGRGLRGYDVAWVADRDAGAKYRTNTRGGDYYAVLRRSRVPAVIVEGLFISSPPEEALLRRSDVRARIAQAIADGLERFFVTDDAGSGFTEPYDRPPGPPGRLPRVCVDPV